MLQNQDNKKLSSSHKSQNKSFFFATGSIVQKMKMLSQQRSEKSSKELPPPKSLRETNRVSYLASTTRDIRLAKRNNTANRNSSSISSKRSDNFGVSKSQRESITGARKRSIIVKENFLDFKTQEAQRVSLPGNLYSDLTQFETEFQSYLDYNIARKESDFFKENSGQNLSEEQFIEKNENLNSNPLPVSKSKFDSRQPRKTANQLQSSAIKIATKEQVKIFSLSQLIEGLKSLKSVKDSYSSRAFSPKRVPNMVKGVSSSTQEIDPDLFSCKDEQLMSKKQPKSLKTVPKPTLGKPAKLSFCADPKACAPTARKSAQSNSLTQVSDMLSRK